MKFVVANCASIPTQRRTPRGVRGLKCMESAVEVAAEVSHPSRGAWIEIETGCLDWKMEKVAPLAGCVD